MQHQYYINSLCEHIAQLFFRAHLCKAIHSFDYFTVRIHTEWQLHPDYFKMRHVENCLHFSHALDSSFSINWNFFYVHVHFKVSRYAIGKYIMLNWCEAYSNNVIRSWYLCESRKTNLTNNPVLDSIWIELVVDKFTNIRKGIFNENCTKYQKKLEPQKKNIWFPLHTHTQNILYKYFCSYCAKCISTCMISINFMIRHIG